MILTLNEAQETLTLIWSQFQQYDPTQNLASIQGQVGMLKIQGHAIPNRYTQTLQQ